jgi:hypothetical protein
LARTVSACALRRGCLKDKYAAHSAIAGLPVVSQLVRKNLEHERAR